MDYYTDSTTAAANPIGRMEPHNCPNPTHRLLLCVYIVPVTFLNVVLIGFIRHRTVPSMRDYKLVLYLTTIIDFSSAWMQFLIGIRPSLENDMQTYNLDGLFPPLVAELPLFAGGRLHYLAAAEAFTANFSFAFGVVPSIYRYFAVCWGYRLRPVQLLAVCLIPAFLSAWSAFTFAYISEEFYEENAVAVAMDPDCLRSLPSFSAVQSESQSGWRNMLIRGWFYGLAGILYSYGVTFFCFWRICAMIHRGTKLVSNSEHRSKLVQRQLTLTIALQAACPMLVTGGSLIFLYIGIKTEFHKEHSFHILFYSFMVFPILNPLISFACIGAYRRGVVEIFSEALHHLGADVGSAKERTITIVVTDHSSRDATVGAPFSPDATPDPPPLQCPSDNRPVFDGEFLDIHRL